MQITEATMQITEATTNDVNTLRLIGKHRYAGSLELAVRVHDQRIGTVCRHALARNFGSSVVDASEWPRAVAESVEKWRAKCARLEAANLVGDTVGRDLFAAYVTE
jgi:hypothetical protein